VLTASGALNIAFTTGIITRRTGRHRRSDPHRRHGP
jgi:hypothetical protein